MSSSPLSSEVKVLGMGNPLLDIMAEVPESFVQPYGVSLGDAILAEEKHKGLYEKLEKEFKAQRIPGGATLNTIRVCQALLQEKNITGYCGCIGNDARGKHMREMCTSEGVKDLFSVSSSLPTGVCGVLVTPGGERTLITDLQSANEFKKNDFDHHISVRESASIVFSAGFFISVCHELMLETAKLFAEHNEKLYCLNLASPFFVSTFTDRFVKLFPYVDFLFSNKIEFLELSKVLKFGTEKSEEICEKMVSYEKKNKKKKRVVVMTQGCEPTIVATCEEDAQGNVKTKVTSYPVTALDKKEIVDTNGAGDAFAAGFLAGLTKNKKMDFCVRLGQLSSRHVIRRSCCTFNFKEDPQVTELLTELGKQ